MLFLAVELDAAVCDYPHTSVGLVAPRQKSCRMSASCPREYGWNILYLKWPYFQAMAHHETQLQCVHEKKCHLKNKAGKWWEGSQRENALGIEKHVR